ncbi:hypothetical protein ACHQM5_010179 [Ranunculus cassubicifolius]
MNMGDAQVLGMLTAFILKRLVDGLKNMDEIQGIEVVANIGNVQDVDVEDEYDHVYDSDCNGEFDDSGEEDSLDLS